MASKIEAHSWVIVRKDKHMKLVQIRPGQKEYIGKVQFTFNGAIGYYFGTSFEIVKGKLNKVDPVKLLENVADDAENPEEVTENGAKDSPPPPAPDSAPTAATNDASDTSPTIGASLLHSSSTIADTSSSTPAATSSTPSSTPVASSANADASRDSSPRIDNRNLCDRDENQRLGRDDIEELRAQGKRGHEIIGHLVNNSLTFKGKTEYSREKYVNRKKKKHFSLLVILKPSTRILCEMYYSKGPSKLCGLRIDTLTQMLLFSNVRAGSKLMIVESALGMVVGAAMERMGGRGKLVHFFAGSAPQKPAYVGFDFPVEFHENYYEYPLDKMKELCEGETVDGDRKMEAVTAEEGKGGNCDSAVGASEVVVLAESTANELPFEAEKDSEVNLSLNNNTDSQTEESSDKTDCPANPKKIEEFEKHSDKRKETPVTDDSSQPPKKKFRRHNNHRNDEETEDDVATKRQIRNERREFAKNLIRQKQMDGLIFCSKFHPTPIVVKLLPFVAPSRPIAIFNQFREPLIDLYNKLKNMGNVVNLKMSESWMREYQVLPGRTHPLMQMSGGGGFLLTGYVVDSST